MEPNILLAQLRALIERSPDLDLFAPSSREHQVWLGQAHALISRWNKTESISFKSNCDFLHSDIMRDSAISSIFGILHRAIADLEIKVPVETEVNFGAGDVYSFFKSLNTLISSAEASIFIIDPYLDETFFDNYLNSRQPNVQVRLLANKNASNLLTHVTKYTEQYGAVLQVKKSKKLHDRVIFIDSIACWLVGQSISHAAMAKPTYLVPLPPDVVTDKLNNYNELWSSANEL